jgi:basic amino acid/polyamine antiporter, APA family
VNQLFRTKSIDKLIADSDQPEMRLSRTLGPWSLTALGIGSVIGTGIFILTGTAAAGQTLTVPSIFNAPVLDLLLHGPNAISTLGRPGAGPGIALSFLIVAIVCALAGLCYAELASMIPIAGSSYTYAYATLGEIIAWIIGWDLILEYAVASMAISVGFSAYFNDILESLFGFHLPKALSEPLVQNGQIVPGGLLNLPAVLMVMFLTWLLVRGVRESAAANNVMVIIKIVAIMVFVITASRYIKPDNWHPFLPNGFSGVLTGSAIVFFTYVGFDGVSTAAEECRNPQRALPFGIMMTLVVCTLLYVSVAVVLTGVANWKTLDNAAPVANVLKDLGLDGARRWVTAGALLGMISASLVTQYGQARIWFAMGRDRLLPDVFSKVHPKFRTPHLSTWIAGFFVAIPAAIWDIGTFADLTNIGTLFAFVVVSAGVVVLRKKQPERPRGFRAPFVPLLPYLSIVCCFILMLGLPLETWIRFVVWLAVGLMIYFGYGKRRSVLA